MIPEMHPITRGMYVRHDEGLLYRVDNTKRNDATGYEETGEVSGEKLVDYTQLEQGKKFPAGTEFGRPESEFRRFFTIVSEVELSAE